MHSNNVNYDPFIRGPFPVGVSSQDLFDSARERKIPIEIWYPATDDYIGQDLDEKKMDKYRLFGRVKQEAVRNAHIRKGSFPLVMFSHGFSGHRRQTTHFCCHLASHGYIVSSPDHLGNTIFEMLENYAFKQKVATPEEMMTIARSSMVDRPLDISFIIDRFLAGETSISNSSIDTKKIGMTGHSFGGWTTLKVCGTDERICAALPLAPAGGEPWLDDIGQLMFDNLSLKWTCDIPTLYLVAEGDSELPLESMHDLLSRTQEPKHMVVLKNADHFHFCDMAGEIHEFFRTQSEAISHDGATTAEKMHPFSELCPAIEAYNYLRGLGLAHMDAHLKSKQDAIKLLVSDIQALMAKNGIAVEVF